MSQRVSEWKKLRIKERDYSIFFLHEERNRCEKQHFIEYRFRQGMKEVLSSQIYTENKVGERKQEPD